MQCSGSSATTRRRSPICGRGVSCRGMTGAIEVLSSRAGRSGQGNGSMNVMSAERRTPERLAGSEYVVRARALIPVLDAAGARIEAERELPADLLDAMHGAEIFRTLLPRSVGGGEVHPA